MKQAEPVKPALHSSDGQAENRPRGTMAFALLICAVGLLTLAVHWPVLSAQAISFDDNVYLFENPLLQQPGWYSIGRFFREVFKSSTVEGYYEPLTLTSLMLDVALGGRADHLRQFHRTSLALHVLNTTLIIILLNQLFGRPWAAALAGLFFGLHPLTVEPVAWVWERKTLLATVFALSSLVGYLRYANHKSKTGYAASLVMFLLSLLAKPIGTPMPALLLLLDYWPLNRLSKRAIIEKLPFVTLSAASAAITIVWTGRGATVTAAQSVTKTLLHICYLAGFYFRKIAWPTDLSSAYAPPRSLSLSEPAVLGGLLFSAALLICLMISWRRTRAMVTGVSFFFVALLPMLGIIGYSWVIASDKYVYLPAFGLLLILVWSIQSISEPECLRRLFASRPIAGAIMILLVVLIAATQAVVTRRYLLCWKDTETLYRHMLHVSPEMPGPHNNLAAVLLGKGQTQQAMNEAHEALRIDPRHVGAYLNLGNALMRQGRIEEAISSYQDALSIQPDYARGHNNLGLALYKLGRIDEAIAHYSRAVGLQPENADAHYNRGMALLKLDRFPEAIESFQKATRWRPDLAESHAAMGYALMRMGRLEDASAQYQQALRLRPNLADTRQQLAAILARQGRIAEAITQYRQALQTKPDLLPALNNLAWILATHPDPALRDGARAVELAERACRITTNQDAGTLDTLAAAYAETGVYSKAIETERLAIASAGSAQNRTLLSESTSRLQLYEARQPYRDRPRLTE